MTKALMGLEGVAYGMEKPGATYWPSHLSCNAKDIDMAGDEMGNDLDNTLLPPSPEAESETQAAAASEQPQHRVIDLTEDDEIETVASTEQPKDTGSPASCDAEVTAASAQRAKPVKRKLRSHRAPPRSCFPDRRPGETWAQKAIHPDNQRRFPKGEMAEYLGLAPRSRLRELSYQRSRSRDVECMAFDVDEDSTDPVPLRSPTTPTRNSRRRLSQSQICRDFSPPAVPKSPKITITLDIEDPQNQKKDRKRKRDEMESDREESDTESETDDEEEAFYEKPEWVQSLMRIKIPAASLLTIDVASPLGQRIKDKYVYHRPKVDGAEEDEGYEKYCRTPKRGASRLRNRDMESYPISFNKRKRVPDYQSHWIKFTWRERQEFLMVLKTGLTARARKLKKRLKPCAVKLKRVTEAEIKKWQPPPRPFQPRYRPFQLPRETLVALQAKYPLATCIDPLSSELRAAQQQQRYLFQQELRLLQQQHERAFMPVNGHLGGDRTSHNDDDLICISDSDSDDSDIKVTAATKRPSSGDFFHSGSTPTKNNSGGTVSGVIRFKCHLCAAEINGTLGSTDFIAEHFRGRHDVHNIRLHQSVDVNGQTVVTIVQDIPKVMSSPAKASDPATGAQPNSASSDEVICIDD